MNLCVNKCLQESVEKHDPTNIYLLKVNYRREICSKLTIQTLEGRH